MLALLADEDFDIRIVRAIEARVTVDVVTVQSLGLRGEPDPVVLRRAAELGRLVLSHDARTMPPAAFARMAAGEAMPGLVIVPKAMAVGDAVRELEVLFGAGVQADFDRCVIRLPW